MRVQQQPPLVERIRRLREDIAYDRLLISRPEAERQLKALLAEAKREGSSS